MAREIKFRAWYPPMSSEGIGTMTSEIWSDEDELNKQIRECVDSKTILLQFTGLKDKNGKEIYEGDIVKWNYWFNKENHKITVVKYDNSYAGFEPFRIENDGHYDVTGNMVEVVGNIYDNPELLNK